MKAKICIILTLIIMLGVCGCTSNESKNTGAVPQTGSVFEKIDLELMEQEILSYLGRKYGEIFEMDKLVREFDGNSGIYYRAVFHSENRPEKGVLYCYAEGEGTAVRVDGVECVMVDDYANVILQEQYAAALQAELGEGVLVKCQFYTSNHMLTDEEFSAGVEACLEKAELYPQLFIYVFTDREGPDAQLKEQAEQYVGRLNVYRQYLYVVHRTGADPADWGKQYCDNYSDFENYLLHDSEAEIVDFSAFELDKGVVKRTVVER